MKCWVLWSRWVPGVRLRKDGAEQVSLRGSGDTLVVVVQAKPQPQFCHLQMGVATAAIIHLPHLWFLKDSLCLYPLWVLPAISDRRQASLHSVCKHEMKWSPTHILIYSEVLAEHSWHTGMCVCVCVCVWWRACVS